MTMTTTTTPMFTQPRMDHMESPFYRWPKGSAVRASAEANVHARRLLRSLAQPMMPFMAWMSRQSWVIAFGTWADAHWPRWFTFRNVMVAGVVAYGVLVTFMALTQG